MLTLDPRKRATIEQIKRHKWMQTDQNKYPGLCDLNPKCDFNQPQQQVLKLMQALGIDSDRTVQVSHLKSPF